MALDSPAFNVYEREREESLARNRQEFVRLGLSSARRLTFPVAGITVDIPKPKQKRADPVRPHRVSARTCGKYQPKYSEASPDKRLRVKLLRLERSRMSTSVESAMPAEQQEQALNITVAKFFNLTTLPTGGYTHRIWKEGTSTRLVEYCAAQG